MIIIVAFIILRRIEVNSFFENHITEGWFIEQVDEDDWTISKFKGREINFTEKFN